MRSLHRVLAIGFAMHMVKGTAPDQVICKPLVSRWSVNPAKPTTYNPAPNGPKRGKRRRQWR